MIAMKSEVNLLLSVSIAAGSLVMLGGCGTVQVAGDYSTEFAGTYNVRERSTEELLPIDSVHLATDPTGSALITFETSAGRGTRSAKCHSTYGKWFRAIHDNPDESFRGYDCWDNYGALWQFVHAEPGSRTTMPLLNRISRHDVTTQSGYLLFVGLRGIPGLKYALDPEPRR